MDPAFTNREEAKYRLHAYIEYQGEESVTATRNISAGYFVAWLTEDHSWFEADDSVVKLSTPRTFPYICFFVRSNYEPALDAWPAKAFQAHPEENEETQSSEESQSEDGDLSESAAPVVMSSLLQETLLQSVADWQTVATRETVATVEKI